VTKHSSEEATTNGVTIGLAILSAILLLFLMSLSLYKPLKKLSLRFRAKLHKDDKNYMSRQSGYLNPLYPKHTEDDDTMNEYDMGSEDL
jgi:hypothetical protein